MPDEGIVTVYAWLEPDHEWTGHATVLAGTFAETVPTSSWPAGTVHLSIAITGDTAQSAAVVGVIGRDGSKLSGAGIETGEDGSKFIERRLDVDTGAPSAT